MVGNLQDVLELDRLGVTVVSVRETWLDTGSPVRSLVCVPETLRGLFQKLCGLPECLGLAVARRRASAWSSARVRRVGAVARARGPDRRWLPRGHRHAERRPIASGACW